MEDTRVCGHTRLFYPLDTTLPAILDSQGVTRLMGLNQAHSTGKYRAWRDVKPRIAIEDWWEVDRRKELGLEFINNQLSFGACVGASTAEGCMRARALQGFSFKKLSGMFVYAQINGGRDAGAMIEDAVDVIKAKGLPLETTIPFDRQYIKSGNIPKEAYTEALRFQALDCLAIQSWQDLVEAILDSYIPVFPVMVGNSYDRLDSEGVAGRDRGYGNHSVHADSLLKFPNAGWVVRQPNSWGADWGVEGCCYLTEAHVKETFNYGAGFAIKHMEHDTEDPQPPLAT